MTRIYSLIFNVINRRMLLSWLEMRSDMFLIIYSTGQELNVQEWTRMRVGVRDCVCIYFHKKDYLVTY